MPSFRQGGIRYKIKVVPSGYDFLGPGNVVSYHVPRNANDVVAKYHDIDYGHLSDRGTDPFITWSEADETFLTGLSPNDIPTWGAKIFFEAKKFGAKLGLVKTGTSFIDLPWRARLLVLVVIGMRSYHGVVL